MLASKLIIKSNKIFRERLFKKPTQAAVEPTNACNLNCPFCLVGMQNELTGKYGTAAHNLMSRQLGFMTEVTFDVVQRELKKFGIKKIYLHFQGEPLLNKLTQQFAMTPLKNNEHEVETARKMAKEIGVHFFTKGYRESVPEFATENPDYRAKYHKKPCKDIYHQIGIYWNGDVVPCCYDVDGSEIIGNVLEHSLKEIWDDKKYREFRKRVSEPFAFCHPEQSRRVSSFRSGQAP